MPKIYLSVPIGNSKILPDLSLLTSGCDCDVKIVDGQSASAIVRAGLVDCDGIIVFLAQPLSDLNASEPLIVLANKLGKKIIGIWPPKAQSIVLPQALEKYGVALLPWDAARLCSAICDDAFEWTDADGGKRSGSKTKRHKC